MKNSKVLKVVLVVLGLTLIIIGSWRLFDPVTFFENSGIVLDSQAGLLSEARATGGAVVGFGIVVLLGAFVKKMEYTSSIVSFVVFFGFGIARLIGFGIDGNPGEGVVQGIIVEFVLGLIGVIAFARFRLR